MDNESTVNDTEDVSEETLGTPESQTQENGGEDVASKIAKLEELARNYKIRAEKAEKSLPQKDLSKGSPGNPDAIDLIKLGKKLQDYTDDELDFVTEHAKSKKPEDILKALENPFIQAGIEANRQKVAKERQALTPSDTQSEANAPKSLAEKLAGASLEDKEKLLTEMGLYKAPSRKYNSIKLS